ncbi:rraga protein [Gautieria morchelliformis]|nr:rraga protein [Gautieria morchelliformis]
MKKKVLLMGKSGSGKTSMRSVIFSNNPASLTGRLGATIDVEQNHVRFLGDLILNLWDCGGQESFMEHYLTTHRSTIFQHVGVLIYVFDVESREMDKDLQYYVNCLKSLATFSPDASIFVLIHKMDLVRGDRHAVFKRKENELRAAGGDVDITVFGTSIWNESLYKAWSRIVHNLIPNAPILAQHLSILGEACGATEVVLFERTTFLVIATSSPAEQTSSDLSTESADDGRLAMEPSRYERTSELIKGFRHSCSRLREEFHSLEMELPGFTAVLDELTRNTYIMIVVHDPAIETTALRMNIHLARHKFEELQAGGTV